MQHNNRELLDTQQLAREIKLSESTLTKMRLSGNGPAYIKLGRRVCYRREDVDAWLLASRRTSTSDNGGGEFDGA